MQGNINLRVVSACLILAAPLTHASTTVTVGTTADGTGANPLTLRAAITQANNASAGGLPFIIQLPVGTYTLTLGELQMGPQVGSGPANNILIIGTNGVAANTVLSNGDGINRVFDCDTNSAGDCTFAFENLTIAGGHDNGPVFQGDGGAGIITGSYESLPADILRMTNCVIANNTSEGVGAGVQTSGGSIILVGCSFVNNSEKNGGSMRGAGVELIPYNSTDFLTAINCLFLSNSIVAQGANQFAQGAAIALDTGGTYGSIGHVTNCVFGSNTVTTTNGTATQVAGGGAVFITADSTTYIVGCTFTNNEAIGSVGGANGTGGNGGAINVSSSEKTNVIQYCRFIGNTASSGGGSNIWGYNDGSAAINANDNWWGSNAAPASGTVSGVATLSDWLFLTNTASPSSVALGETATLTASFLKDSAGNSIAAANLTAFTNVAVSFGATDGSISGAQSLMQSSGTATATFTGTISGSGGASATVDGAISSAAITVVISNFYANVLVPLVFTNEVTISNVPPNTLTFALGLGAPSGAAVDPTTGVFTWIPTRAQASSTNLITITATNNAFPPLSESQIYTVIVNDYLELTLGSTAVLAGQAGSVPLTVSASVPLTNLAFTITVPTDRLTNWTITSEPAVVASSSLSTNATQLLLAFGLNNGPPLTNVLLGQLNFGSVSAYPSAFLPLVFSAVSGTRSDGELVSRDLLDNGQIAVLGSNSLLRATVDANNQRSLVFYGLLGTNYTIESATSLQPPVVWTPVLSVLPSNLTQTIDLPTSTNTMIFYRAQR